MFLSYIIFAYKNIKPLEEERGSFSLSLSILLLENSLGKKEVCERIVFMWSEMNHVLERNDVKKDIITSLRLYILVLLLHYVLVSSKKYIILCLVRFSSQKPTMDAKLMQWVTKLSYLQKWLVRQLFINFIQRGTKTDVT